MAKELTDEQTLNVVDSVTEPTQRYVRVNPDIMFSYIGISPPLLGKIAMCLFLCTIYTKRYGTDDENIINSTLPLSTEKLLLTLNRDKYLENYLLAMKNDKGNLVKRLKDLDDLNIIYCWKVKDQHIFFIERYIRSWKNYNENGTVCPKRILKIMDDSAYIINTMKRLLEKANHNVAEKYVENMFGDFCNKMVSKTNIKDVPAFDKSKDINEHISELKKIFTQINKHEHFVFKLKEFLSHLPIFVDNDIQKKINIELNNDLDDLDKKGTGEKMRKKKSKDDELIPKNPNLGRMKRPIGSAKKDSAKKDSAKKDISHDKVYQEKIVNEGLKPSLHNYDDEDAKIDPFEDVQKFCAYYMHYLEYKGINRSRMHHFSFLCKDGGSVLDLMIDNKVDNINFLNAWLNYFANIINKNNSPNDKNKTSMKTFMNTFDDHKKSYRSPDTKSLLD